MDHDVQPKTVGVEEAMAILGVSRPTIYRRISQGRLKPLPKENPARDVEPLRFLLTDIERLKNPESAVEKDA